MKRYHQYQLLGAVVKQIYQWIFFVITGLTRTLSVDFPTTHFVSFFFIPADCNALATEEKEDVSVAVTQ